jgi:hypothetical protein
LGGVKRVIAQKETDQDEKTPVKYLAINKIATPTEFIIRSFGMQLRIETFFEDSKHDLDLRDRRRCKSARTPSDGCYYLHSS